MRLLFVWACCVPLQVNATYESEVSPGWPKPEVASSRTEREKWIRSKYEHKVFLPEETLPVDTLGVVMCEVGRTSRPVCVRVWRLPLLCVLVTAVCVIERTVSPGPSL